MRGLGWIVVMLGLAGTNCYAGLGSAPPWPDGCVVVTTTAQTSAGPGTATSLYRVGGDGRAVRLKSDRPSAAANHPYFAPDGRDGWLYFDANRRIWAMNVNGHSVKLTSDPWGSSRDEEPRVSVRRRHLVFCTNRTGVSRDALAGGGLTQGPGYGATLRFWVNAAWSATHPDRLWYRKETSEENTEIFTEFDIVTGKHTGRTVSLRVDADLGYRDSISISPGGSLLALKAEMREGSKGRVVVFDFAGRRRAEFAAEGARPTWSDEHTVVFAGDADTNAFYRGNVKTGTLNRIAIKGLPKGHRVLDLVAWPGSGRPRVSR